MAAEEKIQWFAARPGPKRELAVKRKLADLGVSHFIPTHKVLHVRTDRKVYLEQPLIPGLIFLQATKTGACALVNDGYINVRYLIDRSTRTLLVVPDRQMESFMKVVSQMPDALCPPEFRFVPGGRVKVIEGIFAGVEGEVVQDSDLTYVVVNLGGLVCAKVKIPKSFLRPIASN